MDVSTILSKLSSALPATVVAAIALFTTKEIFEFFRRRNERRRKLNAVKLLLAEEIERNYWTHTSMFRLLDNLKEVSESNPEAQFRLHVARDGSEHFRLKVDGEDSFESGQWIPRFSDEQYKKLLPTLAELDETLFSRVKNTYSELADLGHYRNILVSFLAGEDEPPGRDHTLAFLVGLSDERDDYYADLNGAYSALVGR